MAKDTQDIIFMLGQVLSKVDETKKALDLHVYDTKNDMADSRKYADMRIIESENRSKALMNIKTTHLTQNIDDVQDACANKWIEKAVLGIYTIIGGILIAIAGYAFTMYITKEDDINNTTSKAVPKDL